MTEIRVQTEQTDKSIKKLSLISVALFLGAFPLVCMAAIHPAFAALGFLALLGAIGVAIVARFKRWWMHG